MRFLKLTVLLLFLASPALADTGANAGATDTITTWYQWVSEGLLPLGILAAGLISIYLSVRSGSLVGGVASAVLVVVGGGAIPTILDGTDTAFGATGIPIDMFSMTVNPVMMYTTWVALKLVDMQRNRGA